MTTENSAYKDCNISVAVCGPDSRGIYAGTFVITRNEGESDADRQFTPKWLREETDEAAALDALTRLARDVIDGKSDGHEVLNG